MKIVIVDLGCGNIGSVALALGRFGLQPTISSQAEEIASADRVILPGVGSAGFAMQRIEALGVKGALLGLRQPALGICLGMQLLFDSSDEEDTICLGLIPGRVRALQPTPDRPVPNMGWSKVQVSEARIGIETGNYLYFAHSFACDDGPATLARIHYGRDIPVVVQSGNWLGAQFHPERSGPAGARFLEAFLK